jgi:hypothetical protein
VLRVRPVQSRKPLRIELPKDERPRLGRVGIIAIVGFGIGILWPRVVGMRLVPTLPNDKADSTSAELSGAPVDAGVASAAPVESQVVAPPPPAAPTAPPFTVGNGDVVSCRDQKAKRLEHCDAIEFDVLARGRLATLAACDATSRAEGVLSVGFDLDFQKDRVVGLQSGKRTSLAQQDVDALLSCLRQNLGEVSLSGIHHQHDRYTIYYRVDFAGNPQKKKLAADPNVEVTPASGKATVAWDVALVRATPVKDGEVVARVLQGTRVSVSGRSGDWYRVKYDAKGGEGWVFRTAIGM